MVPPYTACVLVAEVPGTDRLADALGATEAGHAVERCMHRVERAAEANGSSARRGTARLAVRFARADAAVLAACEMLERVQALPPLRGLRMAIQIGVHADTGSADEIEAIATRLAAAAKPGHALASAAVLDAVSGGVRQFVSPLPSRSAGLAAMPWPVYAVGRQAGATAAAAPAASRNTQKLRIRHQDSTLTVEDLRPVVLFGRELGNDIVIADPRASRQHARIERTREGFVLIDQSTNGTFLLEDGRVEYCVKNEGVPLKGPGRIGCGFSCSEIERDLLFYDIL